MTLSTLRGKEPIARLRNGAKFQLAGHDKNVPRSLTITSRMYFVSTALCPTPSERTPLGKGARMATRILKRTMAAGFLGLSLCLIIMGSSPATAYFTFVAPHSGIAGSESFYVQENMSLTINATGTARFDMIVLTAENLNRLWENKSYGYFSELSRFNITSVNVKGELLPGHYGVAIVAREPGDFILYIDSSHISDELTIPPAYPWVWIGALIATIGVLAITVILLWKRGRRQP
jgi:hypothetical protein